VHNAARRGAPVRPATLALTLASIWTALSALGCRERAARMIGVDASAPTVIPPAEEPNQVHFTITGPTSVTFDWRGSGRSLRIWSKDSPPRILDSHPPRPLPFSTSGPWQEVTVTDLRPATEYGYEIGRSRLPVPVFFRTPPVPGAGRFVFAAVTDMGASIDFPEVRPVHRLIALSEPAFVLALGDLTYADVRSLSSVDRHFEDVMMWSGKAAYMPVWGEHEWASPGRDDLRNYKGRFALPHPQTSPGAPAPGCCGKDWYWFDYGAVRFISYPEPYTTATWVDWAAKAVPFFEEAEHDPAIEFTVTMGHRPSYSSGGRGSELALRRLLDGFGARYRKYVLNLNGHGHVYERTKPQAHVVHVTAPAGGGELERADTPCGWPQCKAPSFTAFRAIHRGMLRITVQPRSMKIEAFCGPTTVGRDDVHCSEGDIFDHVTIDAVAPGDAPAAAR
jgi:Calcineurin-like phosphoesterase